MSALLTYDPTPLQRDLADTGATLERLSSERLAAYSHLTRANEHLVRQEQVLGDLVAITIFNKLPPLEADNANVQLVKQRVEVQNAKTTRANAKRNFSIVQDRWLNVQVKHSSIERALEKMDQQREQRLREEEDQRRRERERREWDQRARDKRESEQRERSRRQKEQREVERKERKREEKEKRQREEQRERELSKARKGEDKGARRLTRFW